MRARAFLALLLGFLSLTAAGIAVPAAAQPREARPYEARDGIQPLDRLLPGIRRDHPGTFYDAEGPTYGPSGNPHYHLKWMTPEGRVIWYDADARSGRVLRSSPGRDSFDSGDRAAPRPFADRYPPYMAEPYDRGYGRAREQERYANPPPGFGHGPRYGNPYGGWRGGRGDGGRGGRGRH